MLLAIWSTVSTPTVSTITGTMAATEGRDVALFNGTGGIIGHLAAIEAADVAAFTGSVSLAVIIGDMAAIEAADIAKISTVPPLQMQNVTVTLS